MRTLVRPLLAALAVAMLASSPVLAQPGTNLDQYLLFADDELRTKGVRTPGGDLGVNDGLLFGTIDAPASTLAAKEVRIKAKAKCAKLFANEVARDTPSCAPPTPFSPPIVADLAAACGFPPPFDCGGGPDVTVAKGDTRTLTPGTYGDVRVLGAGGKAGTLRFGAGDYTLCSLDGSRDAKILFDGPARVQVVGNVEAGNQSFTGPAGGSGLSPFDVRIFAAGNRVHFSRKSSAALRLCAPNALLLLTEGTTIAGSFVAETIRTERVNGGSTTTTTSSTPSTTAPTTTSTTSATTTTITVTTSTTTSTKHSTTTTTMMMGNGD